MLAMAQDDELDHGAAKLAPGMERHCALTRTLKPVDDMIRFVVGPGDEAVPDIKRKLPGRGIWITASRAALDDAVKRGVFARGFKRNVRVAADLPAVTEHLLEQSALDALAIAGKAGQVSRRLRQGGGGDWPRRPQGPDPRRRRRDGWKAQAGCGLTAKKPRKVAGNRDHRRINRRAIGFGIEPPKCGTCSPACRTRERHFSRPRQALGALSDRKFARTG